MELPTEREPFNYLPRRNTLASNSQDHKQHVKCIAKLYRRIKLDAYQKFPRFRAIFKADSMKFL